MNEIYWITRLDDIDTLLLTASIASGVIAVLSTIAFLIMKSYFTDSGNDEDKDWMNLWFKWLQGSSATLVLFSMLCILTPTTKEALFIYGVGGTIDYIQNNETVQQLPDKVVDALDAWVESLSDKEE